MLPRSKVSAEMVFATHLLWKKITHHATWKEYTRLDVVQCDITRYLSDGVSHGEHRVDQIQLIPLEIEVLLHARDVRICQVGTVKIVEKVHQAAEGQDKKVQFLYEFALGGRGLRAP